MIDSMSKRCFFVFYKGTGRNTAGGAAKSTASLVPLLGKIGDVVVFSDCQGIRNELCEVDVNVRLITHKGLFYLTLFFYSAICFGSVNRIVYSSPLGRTPLLLGRHWRIFHSIISPTLSKRNNASISIIKHLSRAGGTAVAVSEWHLKNVRRYSGYKEVVVLPSHVKFSDEFLDMEVPNSPNIVFVGDAVDYRRPNVWAHVAKLVHKKRPDIKFLWFGEGPCTDELARTGFIDLPGYVSDATKQLRPTDIFLNLTSRETQGLATIEAMGRGAIPVIVSGTALDEIVNRNNGIKVPSPNANLIALEILELINNLNRLKRLSSESLRFSRINFSLAALEERVCKIFSK